MPSDDRLQSRESLVLLSRALEETVLAEPARSDRPVSLLALFQRAACFHRSHRRFARLGRSSSACVVGLAGDAGPMPPGVTACPLDPTEALADRWLLLVLGRDLGAGLVADDRGFAERESTPERARGFHGRIFFGRRAVAREMEDALGVLGSRIPAEVEDVLRGSIARAGRARESAAERRAARAFATIVEAVERGYRERLAPGRPC